MRYAVKLDAYLWADSQQEAEIKAELLAELLKTVDDNHARVIELIEVISPFR